MSPGHKAERALRHALLPRLALPLVAVSATAIRQPRERLKMARWWLAFMGGLCLFYLRTK